MTMYKLYINSRQGALVEGPGVSTIEVGGITATMQEFTKRVVRNQIPEFADCELWEKPRSQWRLMDNFVFRRERWT